MKNHSMHYANLLSVLSSVVCGQEPKHIDIDGVALKNEISQLTPDEIVRDLMELMGENKNHVTAGGLNVNLLGVCPAKYYAKTNGVQLSIDQLDCKIKSYPFLAGYQAWIDSPIAISVKPLAFTIDDDGCVNGNPNAKSVTLNPGEIGAEERVQGLGWFLRYKPYKTTRGLATLDITHSGAREYSLSTLIEGQESGSLVLFGLNQMDRHSVSCELKGDATGDFEMSTSSSDTYVSVSTELSPATISGRNANVWVYPIVMDVTLGNIMAVLAAFGKLGEVAEVLKYLY